MKRSVKRSKRLPAFALDIAALRLLFASLSEVFEGGKMDLSIYIGQKGEDLQFNTVDELESYAPNLPARVTTMTWSLYDWPTRSCRLQSSTFSPVEVDANAPAEAWCAGAIAVVETHAKRNKLWHSFLKRWIVWLLAVIVGFMPLIGERLFHYHISTFGNTSLIVLMILLWTIYFSYGRLFPRHVLVIRTEENWLRRYSTEFTVSLAVLSLIISIIALFFR